MAREDAAGQTSREGRDRDGRGAQSPGWGNGKATAVLFAREDARVLAVDLKLGAAEGSAPSSRARGRVQHSRGRRFGRRGRRRHGAACTDRYGRIDILHDNVGIAVLVGSIETSEEDWDRAQTVVDGGIGDDPVSYFTS